MSNARIRFRVVRSQEELELCFGLVYQEWIRSNYIPEGTPLRYSIYNAVPTTVTFAGFYDDELFMTATLIIDGPLGIPIGVIFPEKTDFLRATGKKLAEVSMLAFDSKKAAQLKPMERVSLLLDLFYTIFVYSQTQNVEILLAKVHPKHASSYERLHFKDFEDLRENTFVQNMSVTGKFLDLTELTKLCKSTPNEFPCDHFMRTPTEQELANLSSPYQYSADDFHYFFIERLPILRQCSPEQIAQLELYYPKYDIPSLIS